MAAGGSLSVVVISGRSPVANAKRHETAALAGGERQRQQQAKVKQKQKQAGGANFAFGSANSASK